MAKEETKTLPELLNVKQVAKYLQLHEVTVLNFARQGRLPAFKVGREWRFREDEIRKWLEIRSESTEAFAKRFDDMWDRLRRKAEAAGYGPEDVERVIQEVREARQEKRVASRA
jgi:excisionase family DNA binding protein